MRYEVDDTIVPPIYRPLLFDETRYLVLYGGRGSAKTSFAYRKYILRAFKNEYFKCVYVRKAAAHIRDSLYAGFKSAAEDLGLDWFFKFYDSDYRIIAKNGNCFIPKGMDDAELTKGVEEASHLLIDEITELTEEDFDTVNALLRTSKTKVQTLVMFNPILDTHWVRKRFFHPEDSHAPHPAFGDRLKILRTTLQHNNFINREEYKLALLDGAAGNAKRIRVDIEGDWGMPENKDPWLYALDEDKHFADDLPFLPSFPVHLSFDFNRSPLTCSATQMSPSRGMKDSFCHTIFEFVGDVQLEDLCNRIKAKYPGSILFVTGDASGRQGDVAFQSRHSTYYTMVQQYLRLSDRQMHINTKNLEHNDSRALCNMMLYKYPNMKVSRKGCPVLVQDMQIATVDDKKAAPGVLKKDRDQFKMDMMDGWRYMIQTYYLEYAEKVFPEMYGKRIA